MKNKQCDMIPFEVKYIHQTAGAILVDIDGEDIWLPKVAIEFDEAELDVAVKGDTLSISISEKMATDKQLI